MQARQAGPAAKRGACRGEGGLQPEDVGLQRIRRGRRWRDGVGAPGSEPLVERLVVGRTGEYVDNGWKPERAGVEHGAIDALPPEPDPLPQPQPVA